ncbi:MAG: BLUF domain-containing protein [Bacteroidota bacterium]
MALAYVSTPTTDFSDRDIVDLLFASRRWNAHYGITGRLVVLEEDDRVAQFYQWIEGPEAALDACFARITADPRHDQIDIRFRGRVEGRRFPGWDMGIHKTGAADFEAEVNATPGEG